MQFKKMYMFAPHGSFDRVLVDGGHCFSGRSELWLLVFSSRLIICYPGNREDNQLHPEGSTVRGFDGAGETRSSAQTSGGAAPVDTRWIFSSPSQIIILSALVAIQLEPPLTASSCYIAPATFSSGP